MSDAPPTPADAQAPAAAESFAPVRFAVLGDAFLDIYLGADGISPTTLEAVKAGLEKF